MRVTVILLLVLGALLGASSCDQDRDLPAHEPGESVVDLSDPIPEKGADPPAGTLGLAAIVPSTFPGIDPTLFEWDNPQEENFDETAPMVAVESRILKVAPGFAARLAHGGGESVRRVEREALESFLETERSAREVRQLSAPKLTAYSGQLSHTVVMTQAAYIQDYTVGPAEDVKGEVEPKPKVGVLNTGSVVLARPVVVEGGIEIRDLAVEVAEELGKRACKATIEHEDRSWEVIWEEPVILVAKSDPSLPKAVRFEEDETLLIPLRYEVKQACANVRALVAKDTLVETLQSSAGPVRHDCVLLLNARLASAE